MRWQLVTLIAFVALLLAGELGFSLGRRAASVVDEPIRAQVATVQSAILGLLALLLGFTFAMAQARFEARKTAVVEEANAIGTANLRAELLPEAEHARVKALFHRYVEVRIRFYDSDVSRVRHVEEESHALQKELWAQAVSAGKTSPQPILVSAFVEALNAVIDLDEKRLAVLENHLPDAIIVVLGIVGLIAVLTSGYACGLSKGRLVLVLVILPILIASVGGLIVDLDRPASGLIRVGQTSMLRLRDGMPP